MATDFREKWVLKPGDKVHCAEHTYTIDGAPLGYGGSSILYPATRTDSKIKYAIKECFPNMHGEFTRQQGAVAANDEFGAWYLEKYRLMLATERNYGQDIFNHTDRAVGIWDELAVRAITHKNEIFDNTNGAIMTVMKRIDQKGLFLSELLHEIQSNPEDDTSLFTGSLPHIHTTACIIAEVLTAVEAVHKAGYIYGDISPGNIFFTECDPVRGIIGKAHLIDFGSTHPMIDGNRTEYLDAIDVFSTAGYRAPEILNACKTNSPLYLDKKTDIYAIGCVLLRCVLSRANILALGEIPEISKNTVPPALGNKISCSGTALQLLNSILEEAMQSLPEKRYPDTARMLTAIQQLIELTQPPTYLLPKNLSSPDFFVPHSRDQKLSILEKAVNSGETVFIWGVGGIGKTEVAIELAKRLSPPKGVYLVHYHHSMKETVLQLKFSGYHYDPADSKHKGFTAEQHTDAEYEERINILKKHYQGSILIVDNFDCDGKTFDDLRQEKAFRDLLDLTPSMQLIFTTRSPVPHREEWEITALSDDALLILMRKYYTDTTIMDEQLLDLIHAVDGHTLTVALIAKTLEESWGRITPKKILKAFKVTTTNQENFPLVTNDQNREYKQKQIYSHLSALFNLSYMSEREKLVMSYASLLPPSGVNILLFESNLKKRERKPLHKLIKLGWLIRTPNNKLTIHPVIREVCKHQLTPSERTFLSTTLRLMLPLSLVLTLCDVFYPFENENSITSRLLFVGIILFSVLIEYLVEAMIERLSRTRYKQTAKTLTLYIPLSSMVMCARVYGNASLAEAGFMIGIIGLICVASAIVEKAWYSSREIS